MADINDIVIDLRVNNLGQLKETANQMAELGRTSEVTASDMRLTGRQAMRLSEETLKLERTQKRLNKQLDQKKISENEARAAMQEAITQSQSRLAIDKQLIASRKRDAALQAKEEQRVKKLKSAYAPARVAVEQYKTTMQELDRTLEEGLITKKEYQQSLRRLKKEFYDFSRGVATGGNQFAKFNVDAYKANQRMKRFASVGLQQVGYQVGDFAVQVQSGTNALVALGQQGSQLLGILGPFGAIAGAALAIYTSIARVNQETSNMDFKFKKFAEDVIERLEPIQPLIDGILEGLSAIGRVFISAGETLINNLGRVVAIATAAVTVIGGRLVYAFVAAKVAALKAAGALTVFRTALIRTGIGAIIVGVGELIYQFTRLSKAAGGFGKLLGMIPSIAKEAFFSIPTMMEMLGAWWGKWAVDRAKDFVDMFIKIAEYARSGFAAVRYFLSDLKPYFTASVAGMIGTFRTLPKYITDDLYPSMVNGFLNIFEAIVSAAMRGINKVLGTFDKLKNFFGGEALEEYFGIDLGVDLFSEDQMTGFFDAYKRQVKDISFKDAFSNAFNTAFAEATSGPLTFEVTQDPKFLQDLRTVSSNLGDASSVFQASFDRLKDKLKLDNPTLIKLLEELRKQEEQAGINFSDYFGPGETDKADKTDYQKLLEDYSNYITSLKFETKVQGQLIGLFGEERTIQEELIRTKEKYKALGQVFNEQEIEQELRKQEAFRKTQEILEDNKRRQQELADTIASHFEDAFMSIIDHTKSAEDKFKDFASAVIKDLYRILVVQQMVGSFDAATGKGSGIAGFIGGLLKRENGGPVSAGTPYLVGERGPELFVPNSNGSIVPNNKMSSGGTTVIQNINISTGVQQTVRTEIRQLMPQIAESAKAAVVEGKRRGGNYGRSFA